jgi:hypothetical protein
MNLVAERLLCLQMNTDGQVQKCIFEVLHREATNVVVVCDRSSIILLNKTFYLLKDMEIDFLDAVDTKPDYSWLDYSPSEQQQPSTTTTTIVSLPSQQTILNNNN